MKSHIGKMPSKNLRKFARIIYDVEAHMELASSFAKNSDVNNSQGSLDSARNELYRASRRFKKFVDKMDSKEEYDYRTIGHAYSQGINQDMLKLQDEISAMKVVA